MHTIDECPRCKKDFMYHSTDYHLRRVVVWDVDSFEVICHECHDEEVKELEKNENKNE